MKRMLLEKHFVVVWMRVLLLRCINNRNYYFSQERQVNEVKTVYFCRLLMISYSIKKRMHRNLAHYYGLLRRFTIRDQIEPSSSEDDFVGKMIVYWVHPILRTRREQEEFQTLMKMWINSDPGVFQDVSGPVWLLRAIQEPFDPEQWLAIFRKGCEDAENQTCSQKISTVWNDWHNVKSTCGNFGQQKQTWCGL